ncbi:MAG: dTDP-glucose 4,6-dehydratase [Candidatus Komeilibacteria bacterium CG_4_9_14_0_8_um_filter_36_9]|uniref:dTDP-glucose 4,6-dehydratase n=1 Tax=Candidatus Komeilibacteria bacterium CG_4_9_14_0_8_um_filter_36_9 TaxID=1974473 RepID=A0A2M8DQW2_9BACT|nr:MAG: dTDP-glucose 4,6-dehydratase [Candidatus Komeilibacteria bacterium CG_4_9_14_0_8_um_filter_36_9]
MKILVTGGAGFGGSNFIRYMLKKYPDYQIINLDKLTYAGNLANLIDLDSNPNYTFIKGDIIDSKIVKKLASQVDAIINYAAETHVDRSILDPEAFINSNIVGVYQLLEAVKNNKNVKKFIQISTDEVFGSIKEGHFKESDPFQPNSPYAAAKASGDLLCRSYIKTFQLPIIVTHSCNYYGPYQFPEKLVPLFITNLMEGKKVPVYGKGDNVREWIHTDDHARAIDLLLHKGELGEVYNIGTGDEKTNMEITNLILEVMGKGEEMIEYVKDRPGHDWRYAIDNSKIKALGFTPEVDFKQGLAELAKWYQDNEKWWRDIKSGEYQKYYQEQYNQ